MVETTSQSTTQDALNGSQLAAVATLLTVILHAGGWSPALTVASAFALFGVLRPGLADRAAFWWAIFMLLAAAFLRRWFWTDNHHLVVIFAVFVMALNPSADTRKSRSDAARAVLSVVFGAAVIAKLVLGQYLDATFGRLYPTFDDRLGDAAVRFGALPPDAAEVNWTAIEEIAIAQDVPARVPMIESDTWFAVALVAWTLVIETGIFVAYALSRNPVSRWIGHGLLLLFCVTTYAVVPVVGFASVLLALALMTARTRAEDTVLSLAFAGVVLFDLTAAVI